MTKVLLSIHVLAAILVIGPIAVAASLFPRYARQAAVVGEDHAGGAGEGSSHVAVLLHRICCGYAVAGVIIPAFGIATGAQLGVLTDPWLVASIILTAAAAAILALAIIPGQRRLLDPPPSAGGTGPARAATRLVALTGTFNLLWAIVVVLMIVRPGSTTGV